MRSNASALPFSTCWLFSESGHLALNGGGYVVCGWFLGAVCRCGRAGQGAEATLLRLRRHYTSLSVLPEAVPDGLPMVEPDQVFVVGVKDAEALSSAFEALKDLMPWLRAQFETRNFGGQTIHTIRAQPNPQVPGASGGTVSYVITRGHFLLSIGRLGLLQEVLNGLETGRDGFWQQDETELLFDAIAKSGAISRSYVDLERWVRPVFQSLVQTSQMARPENALDPERIPKELAVPLRMVSELNEADDRIFSRAMILERKGAE